MQKFFFWLLRNFLPESLSAAPGKPRPDCVRRRPVSDHRRFFQPARTRRAGLAHLVTSHDNKAASFLPRFAQWQVGATHPSSRTRWRIRQRESVAGIAGSFLS